MPTRDTRWPTGTPCWVDVSVSDVDAAVTFYGSVLGWSFEGAGEEYGGFRIAKVGDKSVAGIGPLQDPQQPTVWTTYLASDDVDATAKLISENGGSVLFGPETIGEIGRMAVAMDPTGAPFGVWQAKDAIGIELYNEPGGLCWEDARLTDPERGREFYAAVFGYTYEAIPDAPDDYRGFQVNGEVVGGMGAIIGAGDGTPSHWMAYFSVADVDQAVSAAQAGGAEVVVAAADTPFGRMGVLRDPFGAMFAVHAELKQS